MYSDASEFVDLHTADDCCNLSCDCVSALYREACLKLITDENVSKLKGYFLVDMKSEFVEDPYNMITHLVIEGTFLVYLEGGKTKTITVSALKLIRR